MPDWLTRRFLGSSRAPIYPAAQITAPQVDDGELTEWHDGGQSTQQPTNRRTDKKPPLTMVRGGFTRALPHWGIGRTCTTIHGELP
jgi:hypothetical protein